MARTGFIDTSNKIAEIMTHGATYTATEDCWLTGRVYTTNISVAAAYVYLDGVCLSEGYDGNCFLTVPVKAGQTITTRNAAVTHYELSLYKMISG